MATTGSTGLSNFFSDTIAKQTVLPAWYDEAQKNIISGAGTALGAAPQFKDTVAQGAINTLQGANNPFAQAQTSLNQIASGAANPWITDPTTGAVTPNTNTAMGGLFAAQQNQLNQTLPFLTSRDQAGAIGSGNFGSLRGQTAIDTAKANALANLQAQQMTAAMQNQQIGTTAATGLGNVGQQGISSGLTAGTAQMNAPFQNIGTYGNLVNAVSVPGQVNEQTQMSPLSQIGAVAGIPAMGTGLLNALGVSGNQLLDIGKGFTNWIGNLNTSSNFTPSGAESMDTIMNAPDGTYDR
jgi:hypothetical protein